MTLLQKQTSDARHDTQRPSKMTDTMYSDDGADTASRRVCGGAVMNKLLGMGSSKEERAKLQAKQHIHRSPFAKFRKKTSKDTMGSADDELAPFDLSPIDSISTRRDGETSSTSSSGLGSSFSGFSSENHYGALMAKPVVQFDVKRAQVQTAPPRSTSNIDLYRNVESPRRERRDDVEAGAEAEDVHQGDTPKASNSISSPFLFPRALNPLEDPSSSEYEDYGRDRYDRGDPLSTGTDDEGGSDDEAPFAPSPTNSCSLKCSVLESVDEERNPEEYGLTQTLSENSTISSKEAFGQSPTPMKDKDISSELTLSEMRSMLLQQEKSLQELAEKNQLYRERLEASNERLIHVEKDQKQAKEKVVKLNKERDSLEAEAVMLRKHLRAIRIPEKIDSTDTSTNSGNLSPRQRWRQRNSTAFRSPAQLEAEMKSPPTKKRSVYSPRSRPFLHVRVDNEDAVYPSDEDAGRRRSQLPSGGRMADLSAANVNVIRQGVGSSGAVQRNRSVLEKYSQSQGEFTGNKKEDPPTMATRVAGEKQDVEPGSSKLTPCFKRPTSPRKVSFGPDTTDESSVASTVEPVQTPPGSAVSAPGRLFYDRSPHESNRGEAKCSTAERPKSEGSLPTSSLGINHVKFMDRLNAVACDEEEKKKNGTSAQGDKETRPLDPTSELRWARAQRKVLTMIKEDVKSRDSQSDEKSHDGPLGSVQAQNVDIEVKEELELHYELQKRVADLRQTISKMNFNGISDEDDEDEGDDNSTTMLNGASDSKESSSEGCGISSMRTEMGVFTDSDQDSEWDRTERVFWSGNFKENATPRPTFRHFASNHDDQVESLGTMDSI